MVVANFGMGIRPSSSVVRTDQERQIEDNRLRASLQSRASDLARLNVQGTRGLGYNITPQMEANIIDFITPAYSGDNLNSLQSQPLPVGATGAYGRALNQQFADRDALASLGRERAATNQAQGVQQDAYSQFLGGFGTGGVLGSVSQAGTRDPSQPTASMPWSQPWSTPGFGNPGSLGGLGGYKPSGQQGWGSVFGGGRNPWSLA